MWAAPGAARAMPGDGVRVAFSTVCRRVVAVCARAGVRPVLPVYREHFMAGVPGLPVRHRVRRPVPCPNSPRVAAAPRGLGVGRQRTVSPVHIPDGRGRGRRTR